MERKQAPSTLNVTSCIEQCLLHIFRNLSSKDLTSALSDWWNALWHRQKGEAPEWLRKYMIRTKMDHSYCAFQTMATLSLEVANILETHNKQQMPWPKRKKAIQKICQRNSKTWNSANFSCENCQNLVVYTPDEDLCQTVSQDEMISDLAQNEGRVLL
jgi:hypothetical protein